ncbi:tetratricopeptide repeat protein [Brumimicrobium aurantiacum]|uniref:Tetratricopeptide repeat protein n=1 Tax=Brumimicrobium aurantiacum TaxID=1737063 RepID=A0A3E1EY00_9FLAO|nr:tetratricopeptide repeat protein [Brumimicrobium aurantiacum]RFC54429.1 tetratricopeptide repeat protein [Brumimicrobium aurantiacum]
MMRNYFLIAIVMTMCALTYGQSWEDSLRLGKKLYQEKQFDKAYQTLLQAQKLAPSEVDLSQDIGNAAYRNNDFEMAEKAFRAAASNGVDDKSNAKHWHNVGNSQLKAKDYQSAIESYKNALRLNPEEEQTRYNLSEAQRRLAIQKQQQQQQNQDSQNSEDQKSQDQQNQNKAGEDDNKENSSQENQQNNQGGETQNTNPKEGEEEPVSKLSNQKTERMLEELLKKEMQTKKKVQGVRSGNQKNQVKSGKKW